MQVEDVGDRNTSKTCRKLQISSPEECKNAKSKGSDHIEDKADISVLCVLSTEAELTGLGFHTSLM